MEANIPRPADLPRSLHLGRRALLVARLAVLTLVLLNLQAFRSQLRSAADEHDVSAAQSRLEELRKALPASGRTGYITDGSPTDVLRSSGATRRYYLTQYALAPLVVEPGTEHDLVIGNFDELDPASVPDTLALVRKFDANLMLFRKRTE
jgi:hypothetical protein